MNVFYLSPDPATCAKYHVDKHCVKMILEYAQLLSTAHHVLDGETSLSPHLYKPTHRNHPSAVWVRQSYENYQWLYSLLEELSIEYTYRYSKVHATTRLFKYLEYAPINIPVKLFTEPTPAMPDIYKVEGDSLSSYRRYYNGDKQRMFSWKNRNTPDWVQVPVLI